MLCQMCGKKKANIHVKQVINGEKAEFMLCDECAGRMGVPDIMEDAFSPDFEDFFGSFFPSQVAKNYALDYSVERCDVCKTTFEDISATGKLGCSNCYKVFYKKLAPYIRRIHGDTKHAGKVALCSKICSDNCENKIKSLKDQLSKAVEKQEFEQAAVLRDTIKKLEEECGHNE